ncbi:hypothetical protein RRJ93_004444 [Vibrio parahaemolyticus]|nr:hypothetical protein [Vibrio parahaemolyticus]ELI5426382.1 hypothetical protein [Vibrio parahaemolyticus]
MSAQKSKIGVIMLSESVQGVSLLSGILNIKEKLFGKSPVSKAIEPKQEKYCSLFLEHSYPKYNFASIDQHQLELTLCKQKKSMVPIRHIDWVIGDRTLVAIEPIDYVLPKLWVLPSEACLLYMNIGSICDLILRDYYDNPRMLRKMVKSLNLRCTYANGHKEVLNAPESLKLALFYKHQRGAMFLSWHKFLILNT